MRVSDYLKEKYCVMDVKSDNKDDSIKEIADCLAADGKLLNKDKFISDVLERESLGSTGFGEGIAIPHCVLDNISEFVVGLLLVPDGVNFESLDDESSKLLVFIIGPSSERNNHIRVLATVSQVLRIPGAKEEMLAEKNSVAIRESFLRYSRDEVDTKGHSECCIFHVFVQDENKFYDLLQVFTTIESCSVSVVEAKDATEFLHKLPLFSSFWSEQSKGFNRIIAATVSKSLANDTIRQINDIAGGLDKQSGIMVTVEDVFYAGGALNS